MKTIVVNIRREDYDVYIGRAGKGQSGYFGNPFRVGYPCGRCGRIHREGSETIECFRGYFNERIRQDPKFRRSVLALAGKRLGCFCKPWPCHGDVYVEWIEDHHEHQRADRTRQT